MTITHHFGFWCKHCNAARSLESDEDFNKYHFKYLGLMDDGYYETRITCPVCKKRLVFHQESVMQTIKRRGY